MAWLTEGSPGVNGLRAGEVGAVDNASLSDEAREVRGLGLAAEQGTCGSSKRVDCTDYHQAVNRAASRCPTCPGA